MERERAPHGFVGGLDLHSEGNATVEVLGAADNEPVGRCPVAHPRDIQRAAEAAARAGADLGLAEARAERLEALAALLDESAVDLAILEAVQTGRTVRELLGEDLPQGAKLLRAAAAWARTPEGSSFGLGDGRVGHVEAAAFRAKGAVLPATEAFGAAVRQVAIAHAAGSGLVLLAPAEAPLTVLRIASLTRAAGFPPGAVNVLTAEGREPVEKLAESAELDGLDFAGPRELARRAWVAAARGNLKRLNLELDDKTPCVALDDAEIGPLVEVVWRSALRSPSQLPRSIGRLLVPHRMFPDVANRLTALARATVVGHPLEEHTELGPLASKARLRRVLSYVTLGRREGGKLVAGGERDVEGSRFAGNYLKPTILLDPAPGGRLVREPVEGPVLSIERYTDENDALSRAHRGLGRGSAVVFSADPGRARRFGRRLGAGEVFINGPIRRYPALPHGGGAESEGPQLGRFALTACGYLRTVVSPAGD